MKYIIYLSYLFFLSEFVLMLIKRSKRSSSKRRNDSGSLILLWVMITFCFSFGFIFANYRVWNLSNYLIAGIGLFVVCAGFVVRWMSILQLKKAFTVDVAISQGQELKIDGMYKLIRHPSYLGLILIMIGFSMTMNSVYSALLVVIPMVAVILYRISVEEKVLVEEFGDAYNLYKANTKRLIPWVF